MYHLERSNDPKLQSGKIRAALPPLTSVHKGFTPSDPHYERRRATSVLRPATHGCEVRLYCPRRRTTSVEPRLPSNGLPLGDLSDYSTLLESLQELRYMILSRRNGQVPINRLPVEILLLICKLTLPLDPEFTKPDNRRVFGVTELTHVCRHWRLVLISSPVLWTSFRVMKTTPKFVAECLQRSRTLPIHVSFDWDIGDPDYDFPSTSDADDDGSVADDDDDVVDDAGEVVAEDDIDQRSSSQTDDSDDGTASHSTLSIYPDHHDAGYTWTDYIKEAQGYHHLMQHSHRVATLDISLPVPGDEEDEEEENRFACGLLLYPFPALQTIKLRCTAGIHGSVPKVILNEHIGAVHSLFLEDIIPTHIFDLSLDLTSLTLRTRLDSTIDMGSFLRFLEKNRNLRSLTLYQYNFLPITGSITPVTLSHLHQLDVVSKSATFLRHLTAPALGPQSSLRIERIRRRLLFSGRNNATGTSTSISCLALGTDPDPGPDEFMPLISEVFGSCWEEAIRVVVVIHVGEWEREFVDKFLDRLTRLIDLSVECDYDGVEPWFDSLAASKERCPKLGGIHLLHIAPECCPIAVRSVRKLVKRRAEDGIPLEVVEQNGLSPTTVAIWNDLYDRWRIEDHLKTRDS